MYLIIVSLEIVVMTCANFRTGGNLLAASHRSILCSTSGKRSPLFFELPSFKEQVTFVYFMSDKRCLKRLMCVLSQCLRLMRHYGFRREPLMAALLSTILWALSSTRRFHCCSVICYYLWVLHFGVLYFRGSLWACTRPTI